jgi:serine/threonine protein kinase
MNCSLILGGAMPIFEYVCSKCDFVTQDRNVKLCPKCGTLLMKISKEDEAWEGKIIDSKIRIRKIIGKGGMGLICEAEQIPLERKVAVKLLRKEFYYDALTVRRFLKEAQAAAKLDHQNIISVIDFGQTESGVLYLVMEYLVGKTLRDEIIEKGKLPIGRTKQICEAVCLALSHAHKNRVIHCDLKPENIFLAKKDNQEIIKVLDFGIAKIIGRKTQTNFGEVSGTAEYISPEQIEAKEFDGRADLYSFACVLYECLTGRPPYVAETPYVIFAKHLKGEFEPASKRNPELSDEFDIFFFKALSRDIDWRYRDAEEFKNVFLDLPDKKSEKKRKVLEAKPEVISLKKLRPWRNAKKFLALGFFAILIVALVVYFMKDSDYRQGRVLEEEADVLVQNESQSDIVEIKETVFIRWQDLTTDDFIEPKPEIEKEFFETAKEVTIEIEEPYKLKPLKVQVKEKKEKAIKEPFPPKKEVLLKKEEASPKKGEFKIKTF